MGRRNRRQHRIIRHRHTVTVDLDNLNFKLQSEPEHVNPIAKDLELEDPSEITWLSILLANAERVGASFIVFESTTSSWVSKSYSDNDDDIMKVCVLRSLAMNGYASLRFKNRDGSVTEWPAEPIRDR